MYKIENTTQDGKPIYIAENSLYLLIKNEAVLFGLAKAYIPAEYEKKFDKMLDAALADYPIFLATIGKSTSNFEADVMINFEDLFETLIDIKKKMAQEVATAQADQSVQPTDEVPIPERTHGKNKKK